MKLECIAVGGLYRVCEIGSKEAVYALAIDIAGTHTGSHLLTFYDPIARVCRGKMIPVQTRAIRSGLIHSVVKSKYIQECFCMCHLIADNGVAFLSKIMQIEDDQFRAYADHLVDIMKTDAIDSVSSLRKFIQHEMEILCRIKHASNSPGDST